MEAKDRIVQTTEENCYNTLEERLAEQDVISFKAGQKEVVDTYKRENPSHYKKYENWWQDKLKERGL